MAIAQRAVERTAQHVVAALAVIGRTRPHIHLDPIPVQGTAVVVGAAAAAPFLAGAGRVGRHQVRL